MDVEKKSSPGFRTKFLKSVISDLYQEGKFYKIPFGRLRGLKLLYRKDIKFHYLLGLMEKDQLNFLMQLFKNFCLTETKIIVADIGANLGYYSLFFHKYLHPETKIFAFEPSPLIADVFFNNMRANKADNVKLEAMACADKSGEIAFYVGQDHYVSSAVSSWSDHMTASTKYMVAATTVDDFFMENGNYGFPDLIKMDIEGGGIYALKGCVKCFSEKRPFVLIESHTSMEDGAVSEVLFRHKYDAFRINTKKWVVRKDANYKDPEGVWGTMLLIPSELKNKFVV